MDTATTTIAPIACSLSAAGYQERIAQMRGLARTALTDRVPIPGGELLTFAADGALEAELRSLVAAEAECCAFLQFNVVREADALLLGITGPAGAQAIIRELFA